MFDVPTATKTKWLEFRKVIADKLRGHIEQLSGFLNRIKKYVLLIAYISIWTGDTFLNHKKYLVLDEDGWGF